MEERDEFYLSEEQEEWVGLKKSEYLSKIIENQTADDFDFGDYHQYDQHSLSTLENPDELWEQKDTWNIRVYERTYQDKSSYHHLLIGGLFPDEKQGGLVFVPILSFVTRNSQLARIFLHGERKNHRVLS